MKRITFLVLTIIILTSCGTGLSSRPQKQPIIIKSYIESFLADNPSYSNNEITLKDASRKLRHEFIVSMIDENIPWIAELPLTFRGASELGRQGEYIIEFEHKSGNSGYSVSRDFNIDFRVLAIVDKNAVLQLIERDRYTVSGSNYTFASHSETPLPGWWYSDYTEVYASPGGKPSIHLGVFIVENPSITPFRTLNDL